VQHRTNHRAASQQGQAAATGNPFGQRRPRRSGCSSNSKASIPA
jgi:hypothetical protein